MTHTHIKGCKAGMWPSVPSDPSPGWPCQLTLLQQCLELSASPLSGGNPWGSGNRWWTLSYRAALEAADEHPTGTWSGQYSSVIKSKSKIRFLAQYSLLKCMPSDTLIFKDIQIKRWESDVFEYSCSVLEGQACCVNEINSSLGSYCL